MPVISFEFFFFRIFPPPILFLNVSMSIIGFALRLRCLDGCKLNPFGVLRLPPPVFEAIQIDYLSLDSLACLNP